MTRNAEIISFFLSCCPPGKGSEEEEEESDNDSQATEPYADAPYGPYTDAPKSRSVSLPPQKKKVQKFIKKSDFQKSWIRERGRKFRKLLWTPEKENV